MTTMPIDNHPFTQRRLQFIGISINKLALKSINIIQSSKVTCFFNLKKMENIYTIKTKSQYLISQLSLRILYNTILSAVSDLQFLKLIPNEHLVQIEH